MGPDEIRDAIYADVERIARHRAAAIESACKAALVGGVYGVAVFEDVAMPHPDVPYAQIHYHPRRFPIGSGYPLRR